MVNSINSTLKVKYPTKEGYPDEKQKGRTFQSFLKALKALGYQVEFKELRACDYGAPTIRKRFFMIARCDGKPIEWPKPTHGDANSLEVRAGRLKPWRTASEIIDWNIGTPSIFERKKPLAENTLRRIARGIQKFILDDSNPFVIPNKAAFLTQYYTETNPGEVRGQSLREPIYTIPTANRFGLVTAFIAQHYKTSIGHTLEQPLGAITTVNKASLVSAFLMKYYGCDVGQRLSEPLHTITTRDRFGLVTFKGQNYRIMDIGMRMLQPHELYAAQGFPSNYIIDRDNEGKPYPKTEQVARVGNSVPPPFAEALVRANLPEYCVKHNRYKPVSNQ
jgi:DNA (cytosine-5)-methyltransferase 1